MIDLHIVGNEKITGKIIDSYRKSFSSENNPFIVFGGAYQYSYDKFDNVIYLKENISGSRKLIKYMKRADRIHIHGLFSFWLIGILTFKRRICKKSVWHIHGDDLYCLRNKKGTLRNKLNLFCRKQICSNLGYVSTNVEGDYLLLEKITNRKYHFFEQGFGEDAYNSIVPFLNLKTEHSSINILVGNSASSSNYHKEALLELNRFKDKNIKIFIPLSYGDQEYAKEIAKFGKQLFGEKAIPILDFMTFDAYYAFLMSIDIAIFANDRQQAVGNIIPLIYAGKKVYIRKDISTWDCFRVKHGLYVADYLDLKNEDFDTFIKYSFNLDAQKEKVERMCNEKDRIEFLRRSLISENKI